LKLAPGPDLVEEILAALERQKGWDEFQRRMYPTAAKWLREKRWQEKEEPKRDRTNGRRAGAGSCVEYDPEADGPAERIDGGP
jgi:hypothetical protein